MSLGVNCREIHQVKSKCQIKFLETAWKKMSKAEQKNNTIEFYIFEIE